MFNESSNSTSHISTQTNSNDSGPTNFQPDTTRGYWAKPTDFIFICLGLAFRLDFFFLSINFFVEMGIFSLIMYVMCCTLYVVPIIVILSYLGQFSSTGFLSAFRISPFFKGIGYVSLTLNFSVLTYYSVFAAVPLLFFLNSLKPTLPWSCEVFEMPEKHWNVSNSIQLTICNGTDTESFRKEMEIDDYTHVIYELPSVLFFKSHFSSFDVINEEHSRNYKIDFSWEIFACTVIIWSIIAGIFYKFFNTPKLGKILRYGIWTVLTLLMICIIRFLFLPGAIESFSYYAIPKTDNFLTGLCNTFIHSMLSFGPGWGTIITISSFNIFKLNIIHYSWIICLGQMFTFIGFTILAILVNYHFSKITNGEYWKFVRDHWDIFLSSGSAIASMRFANFWSLLFYGMLTLAALIVMITQFHSLLVSIFDDFKSLRPFKIRVALILIGVLVFFSTYFCTNEGILFISTATTSSLLTQTVLNCFLLVIVFCIYGRKYFNRDMQFMLKRPYTTWSIEILFVVALLCLAVVVIYTVDTISQHLYTTNYLRIATISFISFPWGLISVYAFFITILLSGSCFLNIRSSCRPRDWYPAAQEDRRRYEEVLAREEYQLNELRRQRNEVVN